ncbi:acetyl-CoA carboxylase biotin carboxyl carrier protein subunit [Leucobacter insecticola]|uniref:Acetyl-CoA carboxylase biotin carboxyl carrier protein subunit n=1 Tax=Leucobacter insecticola TaxID=2714934 RepID=A0A6G8FGD8_9MICO|nr:lipoyl domain-containing protein [Leucobacter insecticola]QIM15319.1 acetyl-CoA carboxylase biotin carboxyl carrier protein subunit [Leucobacter insecticola]
MDVNLTKELLGEDLEADLAEWAVEDGSTVAEGQVIASLETSKLVNELLAPTAGVITFKKAAGDLVELDETIATID